MRAENGVASTVRPLVLAQLKFIAQNFSSHLSIMNTLVDELGLDSTRVVRHDVPKA